MYHIVPANGALSVHFFGWPVYKWLHFTVLCDKYFFLVYFKVNGSKFYICGNRCAPSWVFMVIQS